MSIIVPAILPESRTDLEEKLARLIDIPSIDAVQIDAVDGRFATPACWPYSVPSAIGTLPREGYELRYAGRFIYDADLMVESPVTAVNSWRGFGARRLTMHAESSRSLAGDLARIREQSGHTRGFLPGLFELGLAIGIETDLALIVPYLDQIDYMQLMGIANIGKQNQLFDARVLAKIRALRSLDADITIQVDGGVTLTTAPSILDAGADRLIVGHALWQAQDLAAEIAKFEALSERIRAKVL
jgi:ribulose-phosphate 3-epimerase